MHSPAALQRAEIAEVDQKIKPLLPGLCFSK